MPVVYTRPDAQLPAFPKKGDDFFSTDTSPKKWRHCFVDGTWVDMSTVFTGGAGSTYLKDACRAVAVTNITLSGAQTVDGVSLIAGDRCFAAGQSLGETNGPYVVAAGAWTRTTDADTAAEMKDGILIAVAEGTHFADTLWQLRTSDPVILGTTVLVFGIIAGDQGALLQRGAQSIPNAAAQDLFLDTQNYIKGITHAAGTTAPAQEITAKTSGKYHVTANVTFATNATGVRGIQLQKGGGKFASLYIDATSGGFDTEMSCSGEVSLGTTDIVKLVVEQNSGGALNATNVSVTIRKVG